MPAEKGDPRNLTNTAGVHERTPAWSPDGKSIAYFSDEGGEYQLCTSAAADGKGEAKTYKLDRGRVLRRPGLVAATRKKIALSSTTRSRCTGSTSTSGKVTKIASSRSTARPRR